MELKYFWSWKQQRYLITRIKGEGTFGKVCAAKDVVNGKDVAIKKITHINQSRRTRICILREITLLTVLQHPHIIRLERVMCAPTKTLSDLYIVTELMDHDLSEELENTRQFSIDKARSLMHQILQAVAYLHGANVLHQDLKPSNLLLNSQGVLKVCDFGWGRFIPIGQTCVVQPVPYSIVARTYRAPELCIEGGPRSYTSAIDMWSVGCIFAEILQRGPLFQGATTNEEQLRLIEDVLGIRTETLMTPFEIRFAKVDTTGLSLLKQLLAFYPEDRLTAGQALKHPFFEGFDHKVPMFQVKEDVMSMEFDFENFSNDDLREFFGRKMLQHTPDIGRKILEVATSPHDPPN